MPQEKPRIARLTSILLQLRSQSMVTATALAEKYDVSIRTIYRDIRTLEQSGVPITTIEGRGYSLMDGYNLAPVSFTLEEAMALITAAKLIDHSSDQSLIDAHVAAITKIKSVLRHDRDIVELLDTRVISLSNLKRERNSSILIKIQEAIIGSNVLCLSYQSAKEEVTERLVEPFALYQTQGNWILIAYCQLREAYREFRLDRVSTVQQTSDHVRDVNFDLLTYFKAISARRSYTPDIPLSQMPFILAETKNITMEKVQLEAFKLIGISVRTTNENQQAMKDIPALWGRYMAEQIADKIPNRVDGETIAMYTHYEGDHTQPYDMILGCRVSTLEDVPTGMVGVDVPASHYAHYEAKGDLMGPAVAEVWYSIWDDAVNRSFTADFEVYGERAANPKDGIADIYVGMK